MKTASIFLCTVCALLTVAAIWWANDSLAPLFLNSRVERLGETNLPKIMAEHGNTIYCRMKADDFRFPLPPLSRATNLIVTGGFDTVDGSVEARFESTNEVTAAEYERSLLGHLQTGGQVTAASISGGLLIKFRYFGDK